MFKNLTSFGYKRNGKEALGFYLAYLLFIIVVGGFLGGVLAISSSSGYTNESALKAGNLLAVFSSLALSFAVLSQKKLLNNFGFILLAVVSGILAILGGGIFGLIPVAYLTTK